MPMNMQEAIRTAQSIEQLLIETVATPDSDFATMLENHIGELNTPIPEIANLASQFVAGLMNQKDFRLALQNTLTSGRTASFNPYSTRDTYYVQLKKVDNRTVKEYIADDMGNTGIDGEFYAQGIVVTLPAETASTFSGVYRIDENPASGIMHIRLIRHYGDKVSALKAMRGLDDALNGGRYERETMSAFNRMLGDIPMLPSRFASTGNTLEKVAKSTTIIAAKRFAVNKSLIQSGLDGNKAWPRLGMALHEIGSVLFDHGISHDTMNANYFRGNDGRARLGIDFINQEDSFSPTSITNSMLIIHYHQFEETGRWEVIAYLS